ncbi:hypothetical protein L0156_12720 [bacterium]|nr:hypothetical protein [bacterium]
MKDFIRNLVLKTNDVWPFSSMNRFPYYAGVRAFLHICKEFPKIQRVYLRHGLVESDWVPGISDIDLTVLFEPGNTAEEEFAFAVSFWRRVERLKRFFPMLGEIDLLDSKQISSWTRFTIRGKESKSWRLLYAMGDLQVNRKATPEDNFVDSFNHALLQYFNFFQRRFFTHQMNPIVVAGLQRISKKVIRYANADGFEKKENPYEILSALIASLNQRLESMVVPPGAPIQAEVAPPRRISSQNAYSLDTALKPFHSLIQSVYLGEYRKIVVLSVPQNPGELDDCIRVLKRQLGQTSSSIHLVSFKMFDYMLRFFDPFYYTHLMQNRALAFGTDVFEQITAPSMGAFVRCLLDQTVTILPFPTSRAFITCLDPGWYKQLEVDSWVERCLRLKLFLEHGSIPTLHSDSVRESQHYYQGYFSEYQKLAESFSKPSLFRLFRKLTLELHSDLEQYAPDQPSNRTTPSSSPPL